MNAFDSILYGWLGGPAARVSQPGWPDRERRLWVRPQVAYGISREALALTDRPRELRALEPRAGVFTNTLFADRQWRSPTGDSG